MRGGVLVAVAALSIGCSSKASKSGDDRAARTSRVQISKPTKSSVAARKLIDGELGALVFVEDADTADQIVGYLEDVGKQSGRPFTVRELDRLIDVEEAMKYKVNRDAVVLVRGERHQLLDVRAMPVRGGSDAGSSLARFDSDVTSSLGKLARVPPTVDLVLAGGEGRNKYTLLDKVVTTGGFTRAAAGAPAQIIVMIDRGAGSIDEALEKVDAHVAAGGAALIALEPVAGRSLGPLEKRLGVRFNAQPIVDDKTYARATGTPADYKNIVTNELASHPATSSVVRSGTQNAVAFITAGSLEPDPAATPAPLVIARSMATSFLDGDGDNQLSPGEQRKQYALATASEQGTTPGKGRVLVFADADWLSDSVLTQVRSQQLLAFDSLRWLGNQSELDLPAVPTSMPRDVELTRYPLRAHAAAAASATVPLWNEPADSIRTITLTSSSSEVALSKTPDGLTGRESRTTAGSGTPTVREFPVDERAGRELLAALASPRPRRALGTLDGARRREFGLDAGETLVVTGRASHELTFGGSVYGSADRYVLDRASGQAYVLAASTLRSLSIGESALRIRSLVPFDRSETARVVVELNGTKRELPAGDPLTAPAGSPEALGALVIEGARLLRPTEFVSESQAGPLTSLARVTLTSKAGSAVELEILRGAGDTGQLYARSRRGLARVAGAAERLVHTIEQAVATNR